MKWNIGCSGLGYNEWKTIFYHDTMAERKWFNFYFSQFNSLELNTTFYQFPTVEKLLEWYKKSPDDFLFASKVPKLITHFKQLINAEKLIADFYTTCKSGLKEKLGPLLFQFPPKFNFSEERLRLLIKNLDTTFTNVVEFRHSSWWDEEVFAQLSNNNIIFCGLSHPNLPRDIITGPVIYYRFHGVPNLYTSYYKEDILKSFADSILTVPDLKEVNCYFNNTATTGAIKNALFLKQYSSNEYVVSEK